MPPLLIGALTAGTMRRAGRNEISLEVRSGQKLKSACLSGMSVRASGADIRPLARHDRKVPQNEPANAGGAGGAVKRLRLQQ
jgi:hypothetical protein